MVAKRAELGAKWKDCLSKEIETLRDATLSAMENQEKTSGLCSIFTKHSPKSIWWKEVPQGSAAESTTWSKPKIHRYQDPYDLRRSC